jgi:transcriptional regulator with XRE-family HTH domain
MRSLAHWLQTQLEARGLTQAAANVHAGVSPVTMSQILNQDHIPGMDILFRLADYFGTPREKVLRIAARMPAGGDPPPEEEDDYLVEELVREFRQVPDEWKEDVVRQVQLFRRLSERSAPRIIGGEEDDDLKA